MEDIQQRPYSIGTDFDALMELLCACQQAGTADMEFRSIELSLTFGAPGFDADRQTRVLEDGSARFLAFGILWQRRYLGLLARPERRRRTIPRILDWAASAADGGQLTILARSDDAELVALLLARGFALGDEELRMVRSLDLPIPEPSPPEGFEIRPLDPASELGAWLDLYRESIGDRPTALRKWSAYRSAPEYDRGLDLIAAGPDGRLAGACTCTIAATEVKRCGVREGRTEPIMVARRHRRSGLGRALVLAGLHVLRERGMLTAALTTEPGNLPAHNLYRSLGYEHRYDARWYIRKVGEGPSADRQNASGSEAE